MFVAFVNEIIKTFTRYCRKIAYNTHSHIVGGKFLQNFTCKTCFEVKKVRLEALLRYDQSAATRLITHIGYQLQGIINGVDAKTICNYRYIFVDR